MTCQPCEGTGWLNVEQLPDGVDPDDISAVWEWIGTTGFDHDVSVCGCCGNGEDEWYGEPGSHYGADDPPGPNGPYASNGGLCRCN